MTPERVDKSAILLVIAVFFSQKPPKNVQNFGKSVEKIWNFSQLESGI